MQRQPEPGGAPHDLHGAEGAEGRGPRNVLGGHGGLGKICTSHYQPNTENKLLNQNSPIHNHNTALVNNLELLTFCVHSNSHIVELTVFHRSVGEHTRRSRLRESPQILSHRLL